jgi:multidrug efflux pump
MSPVMGFGGIQTTDWGDRKRTTEEIQGRLVRQADGYRGSAFPPAPPAAGRGQFDVELMVTSTDEPAERWRRRAISSSGRPSRAASSSTPTPTSRSTCRRPDRDRPREGRRPGPRPGHVGRDLAVMLSGGYVNRFNYEGAATRSSPRSRTIRATPEQLLQFKVRTPTAGSVSSSSSSRSRPTAPRARSPASSSATAPRSTAACAGRHQGRGADRARGGRQGDPPAGLRDRLRRREPPDAQGGRVASVVTLGFALGSSTSCSPRSSAASATRSSCCWARCRWRSRARWSSPTSDFTTINIYSQVGLITLVGLVAKNGILIVEFANHLQEQGLDKLDAVREAAMTRLRPILMTSAATVFGHFPLVLVTGAGAEARNSIGIVLVTAWPSRRLHAVRRPLDLHPAGRATQARPPRGRRLRHPPHRRPHTRLSQQRNPDA